jgi:hypothetical protein
MSVEVIDLLRMNDRQLLELIRALDDPDNQPPEAAERSETRLPFNMARKIVASIEEHNGSCHVYLVVTRNISRRGAGVLHGKFLHRETRIILRLPRLDGTAALVHGRVRQCRYVRGRIHEIGIEFDQPVELEQFITSAQQESHGDAA